jgi:hypothetical protein
MSAPLDQKTEDKLEEVIDGLRNEVAEAMRKHRPMASAHEGHSVIREELHELWDHVRADTGTTPAARKEALQVAAMGIRYVMDLCDTDVHEAT